MYRDHVQREFARRLRSEATEPERKLWRVLRAQQLAGYKFRRQAAIGPYIVDFVCFSHKLVIELDGVQHAEGDASERDAVRTAWLESRGFQVLRFWNHRMDERVKLVVDEIRGALEKVEGTRTSQPPSPALPAEGRESEEAKQAREGREPEGRTSRGEGAGRET
jgi:very-short-patch-repair endonuclease